MMSLDLWEPSSITIPRFDVKFLIFWPASMWLESPTKT